MKKRLILTISSIFLLACVLLTYGCSPQNDGLEGYPVAVTYYFNGGTMKDRQGATELIVNYEENTKIIEPSSAMSLVKEVTLTGSTIDGWYYAETDSDGNVVVDDNGNPVASDEKFDFANTVVTEDITLVCKWNKKVRLILNNLTLSGNEYHTQWDLNSNVFQTPTVTVADNAENIEGYYLDQGFTIKLNDGDEIDLEAYATVSDEGYYVVEIYVKFNNQ